MDKTMTRRIIGAIVLVLVAALILAALLRGKSKQQEIVDVSSPAEPILQFPDNTQSEGTTDANQAVPGQNLTGGSPTDKVGFDITQGNEAKTDNTGTENTDDNTANTNTSSSTTTTMRDKPSHTDVENERPASTDRSETTQRNLSEKDRLDLDGKPDRISPTKTEERLVNEPKLPKVAEKPKEEPAKEEKPTASVTPVAGDFPSDGFSIQLVATKDQVNAQKIMQEMIGEGYPAYVQPVTINDNTVYRVRIGSYSEKAEAEEVQARMKRRYTKNERVQNSAIYSNEKN
ncbi:MAG TPA: SPOR domain-containing protein [Thiothrix sp.]|nr:SPOR domain-containing protein [Thiothrix sp.]